MSEVVTQKVAAGDRSFRVTLKELTRSLRTTFIKVEHN